MPLGLGLGPKAIGQNFLEYLVLVANHLASLNVSAPTLKIRVSQEITGWLTVYEREILSSRAVYIVMLRGPSVEQTK